MNRKLYRRNPYFIGINSAIKTVFKSMSQRSCRNPYFIGINSAIEVVVDDDVVKTWSQSLFYWN